jgi:hypothetical protein
MDHLGINQFVRLNLDQFDCAIPTFLSLPTLGPRIRIRAETSVVASSMISKS